MAAVHPEPWLRALITNDVHVVMTEPRLIMEQFSLYVYCSVNA
jgi:hypothetical protein